MELPLVVEVKGRDRIEVVSVKPFEMKIIGCDELFKKLLDNRAKQGPDLTKWNLVEGDDHVSLLVNELILKLKGEWKHPYPHEEVCHCRTISLETVEQSIMNGAHTPEMVSRWTSASTACGTCRSDVEKILNYRLKSG